MGKMVKTAIELAEMIKTENVGGKERLPNTETHMKHWCAHFAMDEKSIRKILDMLRDSHYIFREPLKNKRVPKKYIIL